MSISNDGESRKDRETRAFDALVAAALRAEGNATLSDMSVEKIESAKSLLSAEDRAALEISDPRHVRRLVEKQLRDVSSGPAKPGVRRKRRHSVNKNSGRRKGVLVMKSFVVATSVATVLVVVVVLALKAQEDGPGQSDEMVRLAQESRLSQLEEKLAAVEGLREDVRELSNLVATLESKTREREEVSAQVREGGRDVDSPASQKGSIEDDVVAAVAEVLKTSEGQEKLYGAVKSSVERFKNEEREERELRTAEIKEQIEEFKEGPYGKYNLKVNSMAKWLDLNDYQRGVYHTQVVSYDESIQEVRSREKDDTENRDTYRRERKDLRKEFASRFADCLLEDQTEIFNAMSDYAKRPDGDERMTARIVYGREFRGDREARWDSDRLKEMMRRREMMRDRAGEGKREAKREGTAERKR